MGEGGQFVERGFSDRCSPQPRWRAKGEAIMRIFPMAVLLYMLSELVQSVPVDGLNAWQTFLGTAILLLWS